MLILTMTHPLHATSTFATNIEGAKSATLLSRNYGPGVGFTILLHNEVTQTASLIGYITRAESLYSMILV